MLFFVILILGFSSGVLSADDCTCQGVINGTTSSVVLVGNPSTTGDISGNPCAAKCSTTVNINGQLPGGTGLEISILSYNGSFTGDFIAITTGSGDYVYNFTTDPLFSWSRTISSSSVVFTFDITIPIDLVFSVKAVAAPPTTTTTAPPPTTPPYNGNYSINPALTMIDLTVAIDISSTNQYFSRCTEVLQNIANIFSYNYDDPNSGNARLSFFAFSPTSSVGFGLSEPWSLNNNTLKNMWLNVKPVTGTSNPSKFFDQFGSYFDLINNNAYNYDFRPNVQRVFLYCTSADADKPSSGDIFSDINGKIDDNDLKVIVINMDPGKSFDGTFFPNLYKLQSTGSNRVSGYTTNDPASTNLKDIVDNYIQNGNQLCNIPSTVTPTTLTVGNGVPFSVPINGGNQYCNYMNVIRQYFANPLPFVQFAFTEINLNYNKDFLIISADDTEISRFTGQYQFVYICANVTQNAKLTFTSVGDKVYSGFKTTVTGFDKIADCQKPPSPPPSNGFKIGQHPQYKLIHV